MQEEEEMKTVLFSLWLLMIGIADLRSQDISLWIRLSEDRVFTECRFYDLSNDTLYVLSGNRIVPIPLVEVYQIRGVKNSSINDGVLMGSGCGVIVGSLIGLSLNSTEKSISSTGASCLAFGVLGGIVGGVMAALEKPGDLVTLGGKSVDEKIRLIREVIRSISSEGS